MEEKPAVAERKFTPQQSRQVYRLKTVLKHRKSLWRRVEIQGGQTLADFDSVLHNAFDHGTGHLASFYKLVRRGQTNHFREIRLGNVDLFSSGDGLGLRIAGLGLRVGDRLKYVYYSIEHEITLEAIVSPQPNTKYPRISERNKPR